MSPDGRYAPGLDGQVPHPMRAGRPHCHGILAFAGAGCACCSPLRAPFGRLGAVYAPCGARPPALRGENRVRRRVGLTLPSHVSYGHAFRVSVALMRSIIFSLTSRPVGVWLNLRTSPINLYATLRDCSGTPVLATAKRGVERRKAAPTAGASPPPSPGPWAAPKSG